MLRLLYSSESFVGSIYTLKVHVFCFIHFKNNKIRKTVKRFLPRYPVYCHIKIDSVIGPAYAVKLT